MSNASSSLNHQQLSQLLSEGISQGKYRVGSLLPNEMALCAQYGMSRYSVRKALDELQEIGLISRRKNVGTRVEAQHPASGYLQSLASVEELAQFGAKNERRIQSMQEMVMDTVQAKHLACAPGSRWFHIASLRFASGSSAKPISWTEVFIEPRYAHLRKIIKACPNELISSIIERNGGRAIATIHQDIEAISIPTNLANALAAEAGSPALQITRRYYDAVGSAFEISRSIHPANRFKLSTQLARAKS